MRHDRLANESELDGLEELDMLVLSELRSIAAATRHGRRRQRTASEVEEHGPFLHGYASSEDGAPDRQDDPPNVQDDWMEPRGNCRASATGSLELFSSEEADFLDRAERFLKDRPNSDIILDRLWTTVAREPRAGVEAVATDVPISDGRASDDSTEDGATPDRTEATDEEPSA